MFRRPRARIQSVAHLVNSRDRVCVSRLFLYAQPLNAKNPRRQAGRGFFYLCRATERSGGVLVCLEDRHCGVDNRRGVLTSTSRTCNTDLVADTVGVC